MSKCHVLIFKVDINIDNDDDDDDDSNCKGIFNKPGFTCNQINKSANLSCWTLNLGPANKQTNKDKRTNKPSVLFQ